MNEALLIGRVLGAYGVRGALNLHLYDCDSVSLSAGVEVSLHEESGNKKSCHRVLSVVAKPGTKVVRIALAGLANREQAEQLRGLELRVARAQLKKLDEGEFYLADMLGCHVQREIREQGAQEVTSLQDLGEIVGVTTNGAQDLFEVCYARSAKGKARTWLLPILPQFFQELSAEKILVDLPEGMLPSQLEP